MGRPYGTAKDVVWDEGKVWIKAMQKNNAL
jgi:hypothetical protein